MRYVTGIVTKFEYPEFTVKIEDLGKTSIVEHVLFVANGTQDQGTFYPSVGDLVLMLVVNNDEYYILNGIRTEHPRIDLITAYSYISGNADPVTIKINKHLGDGIRSKDPVTFISGSIKGNSCSISIDGGRFNIIITKPGDIEKDYGWKYYDIPIIGPDQNIVNLNPLGGTIETGNEQLLSGIYDAINIVNMGDQLTAIAVMAGLARIAGAFSTGAAHSHLPAAAWPLVGIFHAHPIKTVPFTPIRYVWRTDD